MTNLLNFLSIPLHWWKSRHNLSWVLRKKNYTVSPPNWFTMKESMTLRKRLSRTHCKSSCKMKQLKLLEKTKYFKVWAQICIVSQRFIHWCLISNNALSREKTRNYCICVFQIIQTIENTIVIFTIYASTGREMRVTDETCSPMQKWKGKACIMTSQHVLSPLCHDSL